MAEARIRPSVRGCAALVLAALAWIPAGLAPVPAAAESRVALVIGNAAYGAEVGNLLNPANDAKLVGKALKNAGFAVEIVVNADQKTMKRALSDFGKRLAKAGPDTVGLFYYAGHGVQIGGENYLVPLGAHIETESDVDMESVNTQWIMDQLAFAGNRMNIIVLDACRNNPMARSMRSVTKGLARMDAPKGSFVAYSTAPGDVALDGSGADSPYSQALAAAIENDHVPLEELFRAVRVEVMKQTGEKQVPWDSSSLTGEFFFRPPAAGAQAAVAPSPATQLAAVTPAAPAPSAIRSEGVKLPTAPGQTFRDCPDCPELAVIPAGSFTMGSPASEDGHNDNEAPAHKVEIGKPFALMTTEVTRDQFAAFLQASGKQVDPGCYLADGGEGRADPAAGWQHPGFEQQGSHPVVCVIWNDAQDYADWLSQRSGKHYRLPSEAEWEYAARAGSRSAWPWGDAVQAAGCKSVNIFDAKGKAKYPINEPLPCSDGFATTAPVGSFPANRFGLKDMIGNAWEWVEDCYHKTYQAAPADGTAWESGDCAERVMRGGAWLENAWDSRFARRMNVDPTDRDNIIGFRLARDLE